MYEYSVMVYPIQVTSEIGQMTGDQVAQGLTIGFQRALQLANAALRSPEFGKDWEMVSHEVVRLESHLLISFLLRRPK